MVGDGVKQESRESLMGDCRPLSPRLYGTVWGVG